MKAGQSAYSLEFSNAARTAMIVVLVVVLSKIWSSMLVVVFVSGGVKGSSAVQCGGGA